MQLQTMFIKVAKQNKNKTLFIDGISGEKYSYNKILIACLILSHKLKKYKEKNIGIMIPTSAGCCIAVIAALMAGKIPVMINYSTGAIQNSIYAKEKCNFNITITSSQLLEKLGLKPIENMVFMEDLMKSISLKEKIKAAIKSLLPFSILRTLTNYGSIEEQSIFLFTSGSEKEPKVVPLTHKNIFHQLTNLPSLFDIYKEDIFLSNLPLFHIFGYTTMFWLPIYNQCSIITHANPLDYKAICDSIEKYKITFMVGTPTFFHGYLKKSKPGTFDSIRVMVAGADKLHKNIRDEYLKIHNKEILEGYGTTETSPVISCNRLGKNVPGSIGNVMRNMQIKILDIDTDEELPRGKMGKIFVKGDSVMKGYYNNYEETKLHIKNGWYNTGDLGILDKNGYLWHKGRLRRFVKIGGEMVSLAAVEQGLEDYFNEDEDVMFCAVELPNIKKGCEIGFVTTKEIDKKKVLKYMSKKLPKIALPKKFFVIKEIPVMGNGKVNFREVEKICKNLIKEEK